MSNTKRQRAREPRVQLDAPSRAFVFILWARNADASWTGARKHWSALGTSLGNHLAGYPAKALFSIRMSTATLRPLLAEALEADSVAQIDAVLRPVSKLAKQIFPPPPFDEVLDVVASTELRHVRRAKQIANELAKLWSASATDDVAQFVESYNGPLGKVEAAAEQFSLPIEVVAAQVNPAGRALARSSGPVVQRGEGLGRALDEALHELAKVREENVHLRALVAHYLRGDHGHS